MTTFSTLVDAQVQGDRVYPLYEGICRALEVSGVSRAEAICGLLMAVGAQVKGKSFDSVPELQTFVKAASDWLGLYFMPVEEIGGVQ